MSYITISGHGNQPNKINMCIYIFYVKEVIQQETCCTDYFLAKINLFLVFSRSQQGAAGHQRQANFGESSISVPVLRCLPGES